MKRKKNKEREIKKEKKGQIWNLPVLLDGFLKGAMDV